jgi:outer membrane immunogenic protein
LVRHGSNLSRFGASGKPGAVQIVMLRRIALASVSILALTPAASAADLYVTGPAGYKDGWYPSWAGFYVGVNGGYGWSPHNDQLRDFNSNTFPGLSPEDAFGGGQIGYNVQLGKIVLGYEADIQDSGIGDKKKLNGVVYQSDLDWFGTARGRIGHSMGPALAYLTGGLAYGEMNNRADYFGTSTYKFKGTVTGYVLGSGLNTNLALHGR